MRLPSSRTKKASQKLRDSQSHKTSTATASDDASSELHQQQAAEASCGAAAVASKPKRKRGRPQKKQQQAEQADEEPEELEEQAAAVAAATVLLANLDGDYTEEENLRFADMAKGSTKDSTNNLYAPYQKLYNDFCESHGIAAQVTSKKDIPKLTRWYELFCEGKAGGKPGQRNSETKRLAPQTAMVVHSALKRLVEEYCIKARAEAVDLLTDLRYRIVYKKYTKGRWLARVHNTHMTFKRDDHIRVMMELYAKGDAESIKTRLLFALCVSCVARGDEVRELTWSQLYWQLSAVIGPMACCVFSFMLGERKVHQNTPDIQAFIRGSVPEACPLDALGQLLHLEFKVNGAQMPAPGIEAWNQLYIFTGRNAGTPISYSQHKTRIDAALEAGNVARGKKSTHIARDRGAELMNEMGCPLEDIQRAGGWKQDPCGSSYIVPAHGPRSLLALAMWLVDGGHMNQAFYADHFALAVVTDLVQHMAPWLPDVLAAAEAGRDAAAAGDKSKDAVAACLPAVQVMFRAIVAAIQNAVVLADNNPDNIFIKDLSSHPKFENFKMGFLASQATAATAAAAAGGLKAGSRDKAAAAAKGVGVREVPQLKSWSTWGQMWQWFYEEKIQHPNKEGEEATRAELYSQNVRWAPINLKPRASEYNAMYKRINKHALELTQKWGRPVSVAEAAEELAVMEKKVTQLQNGGMTMYAFMVDCRKWLQAQAKKAADAVDDGAVEGE
ncbi:hypothetical protein OEZ86_014570 [Tetradesmus obliquus]|nr:hypothetical protein OEZ86_014570 [Tetradesmus obliquus]